MEVDDIEPVLIRARQLNYPAFYGDPAKDTHGNPAIAGLSEGLLYFVGKDDPSIWERDFSPIAQPSQANFLTRIDHLSFTMPYEEMLRSILLYRSMFDMKAASSIDLYDPGGLVRSQVMKTDNNAVCFALNSSSAQQTLSNQILERQAGSGVQHIALETKDIKAIAHELQKSNTPLLCLPENYYADLQARFNLSDSARDELRKLNLLYDEDETGHFWQLYTTLFASAFCFEIVQRENYTGFGAANAPMRSAVQSIELERSTKS